MQLRSSNEIEMPSEHGSLKDGGRSVRVDSGSAPQLACYLYLPREPHPEGRVLVSVHGVSRNVEEHIELFGPLADRYGVFLIVPIFAAKRFRDFQRLGRKGRGPRADLALIRLINDLRCVIGQETSVVDLFGFSGGAQFAHRFALAYPQRVRRLALGAAGWYTMPDNTLPYPYGTGDSSGLDAVRLNVTAAARLPTLVLVGECDNRANDEELNRSQIVCRSQGRTRLQRARNWARAINAFAEEQGETKEATLMTLPGVDHSFRDAVVEGGMSTHIFRHFYGTSDQISTQSSQDTEKFDRHGGIVGSPDKSEIGNQL